MLPLDHLLAFFTTCRSTLLKSCEKVATELMSFDPSWDTLAVLKGGMRIHYSDADPSEDSGCTEPLSCVVVFNWNKEVASALS